MRKEDAKAIDILSLALFALRPMVKISIRSDHLQCSIVRRRASDRVFEEGRRGPVLRIDCPEPDKLSWI